MKLEDKRALKFTGFPKIDRQSMPAIFQQAVENYRRLGITPDASQSRENLCCKCFHVVPKGDFTCENCGAEYWRPRELAFRSLAFPSWGDLCMKHYGFALFEMFGYAASWAVVAIKLAGKDQVEGWILIGFILLIEHPIDAILTYNLASKGLNHRRDHERQVADSVDDNDADDSDAV